MNPIELKIIPNQTQDGLAYQHLRLLITTQDGIITPDDLQGLKLPQDVQLSQGIVIEGRGAIWLYGYLVHECHPAAWVGCYDPRLEGRVSASQTLLTREFRGIIMLGGINKQ
ncbi:CRISPR-associated ring nuclease Crn3/Csx3, partial [Microcoleus sp. S13_C5]|uniref:CRISPR-associated ring nuclease Crn3/Csx3 n=1 Tax=Microcoleus sp. S13_C5 TaxID=3055411 RepID=UPI002FD4289B